MNKPIKSLGLFTVALAGLFSFTACGKKKTKATTSKVSTTSKQTTKKETTKATPTTTKHVHSFSSDWTIDLEPTCTKEGSKSHHCACGEKSDVTVVPKLDHTIGNDGICSECKNSFLGEIDSESALAYNTIAPVYKGFVYLKFETVCPSTLYFDFEGEVTDQDALCDYAEEVYLYRASDLENDCLDDFELASYESGYMYYETDNRLECDSTYYLVIKLSDSFEKDEIRMYIDYNYSDEHEPLGDGEYKDSLDGSYKYTGDGCKNCEHQGENVEKIYYIRDLGFDPVTLIAGKTYSEVVDAINNYKSDEFTLCFQSLYCSSVDKGLMHVDEDHPEPFACGTYARLRVYIVGKEGYVTPADRNTYYTSGTQKVNVGIYGSATPTMAAELVALIPYGGDGITSCVLGDDGKCIYCHRNYLTEATICTTESEKNNAPLVTIPIDKSHYIEYVANYSTGVILNLAEGLSYTVYDETEAENVTLIDNVFSAIEGHTYTCTVTNSSTKNVIDWKAYFTCVDHDINSYGTCNACGYDTAKTLVLNSNLYFSTDGTKAVFSEETDGTYFYKFRVSQSNLYGFNIGIFTMALQYFPVTADNIFWQLDDNGKQVFLTANENHNYVLSAGTDYYFKAECKANESCYFKLTVAHELDSNGVCKYCDYDECTELIGIMDYMAGGTEELNLLQDEVCHFKFRAIASGKFYLSISPTGDSAADLDIYYYEDGEAVMVEVGTQSEFELVENETYYFTYIPQFDGIYTFLIAE